MLNFNLKNERILKYIKTKVFNVTVSGFIVLFPVQAFSDTLRIATDEWCPYDCIPSQNKGRIGYLGELLVETMKAKGHQVEFIEVSYSRGLELVREGKLDGTMACFKEDAPEFIFPDFPLGKSSSSFFTHKDSKWHYSGINSLSQVKMIGVIDGYDYVDANIMNYINKKPNNILFITGEKPLERLLKMLINGRLTAVIEDKSILEYKIKQMGKADMIKMSGTTDTEIDIYSSFSPKNKKSSTYAKILSQETIKMRQDGRLQKLFKKYGIKDWQSK